MYNHNCSPSQKKEVEKKRNRSCSSASVLASATFPVGDIPIVD